MATIVNFPDEITQGGPYVSRLIAFPLEFPKTQYVFDDGGLSVNVQPCGLQRWELQYEGLTGAEVTTLLTHFNLAKGKTNDFTFYDRQNATTYTGCKYEAFEVNRHRRSGVEFIRIVLVKFL